MGKRTEGGEPRQPGGEGGPLIELASHRRERKERAMADLYDWQERYIDVLGSLDFVPAATEYPKIEDRLAEFYRLMGDASRMVMQATGITADDWRAYRAAREQPTRRQ